MHSLSTSPHTYLSVSQQVLKPACLLVVAAAFLYVVWGLYLAAEPLFAAVTLALGAVIIMLAGWARFYTWRFVIPSVAAVALFIVFPVLYTTGIGFTNFSARNILTLPRVQAYHLKSVVKDPAGKRPFALTDENRLYFPALDDQAALISQPITDAAGGSVTSSTTKQVFDGLPMREVLKLRTTLQSLVVETPDGRALRMDGLRAFSASVPLYTLRDDDVLVGKDGTTLTPNHELGFYQNQAGETVSPGWRVNVGFHNFKRILLSDGVRQPMLQIFLWTCTFAFVSVLLTFIIGTMLAVILNWEHLAFRGVYRVLLLLPYAVPAFISILVFRGLYNQNFGEINLILNALFGIKPEWFTSPLLAKVMLVTVNTWLGFPYFMLLSSGFIQAIPKDHYKAAAIEGSGPLRSFVSITLPQILPPSIPLLIGSFAFNFNNLVIVLLLTRGGPDIPGTIIPAGSTDLLGTFTFRIAFQNSNQDFGLASAISAMIFIVTGLIAYINFRFMQSYARKKSAYS